MPYPEQSNLKWNISEFDALSMKTYSGPLSRSEQNEDKIDLLLKEIAEIKELLSPKTSIILTGKEVRNAFWELTK